MAFGRPLGVEWALNFKPIQRDARTHVFGCAAGDLADAQTGPRNRHRVKNQGLQRIDPGGEFVFLRNHGGCRERGEQSAPVLLVALGMRPEHGSLGRLAGFRVPFVPVKSPDRGLHPVQPGVNRGNVQSRLVPSEVRVQQAHGALRFFGVRLGKLFGAFRQVGSGIPDVPLSVLEPAPDRQRRVVVFVFEKHKLTLGEVALELEETRRIDAALENRGRRAACGNGCVERLFHGFLISSQVRGGDVQPARNLVVS